MNLKENYISNIEYRKYDAIIIMPQVISIKTFYISKCIYFFFTFFPFLNVLPDCTRKV